MENRKKRAALHNLGCKVNAYETEAMKQLLEEHGYEIVSFEEEADVCLINTCSVTNMADRKSRQMLHRARKKNPHAVIVAAGCYVQAAGEEIVRSGDADLVIGNNQKARLPELLEPFFEEGDDWKRAEGSRPADAFVIDIAHISEYEEMALKKTAEHTRAFIKIQDGCNQFCSYCIIPYTRGRIRSRRPADVLSEVRRLSEAGYREVVLTGIHLSSYGKDLEEKISLLEIIRMVHQIPGIQRIRLGSLEPRIITEEFVKELSSMEKVCPHFHLSLQSGCDATLSRMNRHYTAEEYYDKCKLLRKYYEHPAITTDVIVGFPQETEEEFRDTLLFLRKTRFYEMHIFKYSKRQGTKAASMTGQVPEEMKTLRSHLALKLEAKLSEEFRYYYMGKTAEILLEEFHTFGKDAYVTGFTREYVKAAVKLTKENKEEMLPGRLIKVKMTGILGDGLLSAEWTP